jgi:hypothetical protein
LTNKRKKTKPTKTTDGPKDTGKTKKTKKNEKLEEVGEKVAETLKKDAPQTKEIDQKSEATVNIVFTWLGTRSAVKITHDETVASFRKKLSDGRVSGLGFSMPSTLFMIMQANGKELRGLKEKILDHFTEKDMIKIDLRKN